MHQRNCDFNEVRSTIISSRNFEAKKPKSINVHTFIKFALINNQCILKKWCVKKGSLISFKKQSTRRNNLQEDKIYWGGLLLLEVNFTPSNAIDI